MDHRCLLYLHDYLSQHIALGLDDDLPQLAGCDGTFAKTIAWLAAQELDVPSCLRQLRALGAACDCEVLLNIRLLTSEDGATLGLNMRRCQSCNALLAVYQVTLSSHDETGELCAWAAKRGVPAYLVVLQRLQAPARVRKIYPAAGEFALTEEQFYKHVLGAIERQHRCLPQSA